MTPADMADEMRRLSQLIDDALGYLRRAVEEWAAAEDAYRCEHARAYLTAGGTAGERKAHADLGTSDSRQRAHLADGMRQAALEAVRSRRAQISALQSLMSAHRAEAEFVRTAGP